MGKENVNHLQITGKVEDMEVLSSKISKREYISTTSFDIDVSSKNSSTLKASCEACNQWNVSRERTPAQSMNKQSAGCSSSEDLTLYIVGNYHLFPPSPQTYRVKP